MELKTLREQIDQIDNELVQLFSKRMAISAQVADYKKEHNMPIHVPTREREILQEVAKKAGPEMDNYARVLYSMIFELSRSYQRKRNTSTTQLYQTITDSIDKTTKLFPQSPTSLVKVLRVHIPRLPARKCSSPPLSCISKILTVYSRQLSKDCVNTVSCLSRTQPPVPLKKSMI